MALDANDLVLAGEIKNVPPEALEHEKGDHVLVWAKKEACKEGLVPAIVRSFNKSGGEAFTVCTEDGCTLTYQNAADAPDGHFCLALPHGTCGNARSNRLWLQLYAIGPGSQTGLRGGWRGLLVGAGARAIGGLVAHIMELMPDADDSSIEARGSNGESYWLFAQAAEEAELRRRVGDAAKKCLRSYSALQKGLEAFQSIGLHAEQDCCVLTGPCARALVRPLRELLPGCAVHDQSETRLSGVRREKVFVGTEAAAARTAVKTAMSRLGLPQRLLSEDGNATVPLEWRCSAEGPDARTPGLVPAGWSCPANTLAVTGPLPEAVCLVNYARMQGEAPVAVHAEALLPARMGSSTSGSPAHAAANTWALGGLHGDQAGGSYFGPWDIQEARSQQEKDDQDEILPQWSTRNLKRILEGKRSWMSPGRYDASVSLENAPGCIEWEDFKEAGGTSILCELGWCSLENPREWIRQRAALKVRLTIWPMAGAAFPQAKFREAPVVRLSRKHLYELEQNAHLQERLAEVFITGRRHEGLENWNGQKIRRKQPEPLPFCASAHPEPLEIARKILRGPRPAVKDIEDIERWAALISGGERPCSLCGTCTALMSEALPHLWRLETQPGRLVCTFPSSWRPRAPVYLPQTAVGCALPAPHAFKALPMPGQALLPLEEGSHAEEAAAKLAPWNIPPRSRDFVLALLARTPPAAMEGCRHLLTTLAHMERQAAIRNLEVLQEALPRVRDDVAAKILGHVFLGVTRGRQQGCALARTLTDLSAKSPKGREPWSLGGLLRLAALPCAPVEHKALTTFLSLFAQPRSQRAHEEAERQVREWLGPTNGEHPLLGLAAEMLKPSARRHLVDALEGCCSVPRCDLRCACRLMLAPFRPAASSEATLWSAAAITRWTSLTLGREQDPWTHEESIERLKIVGDSGLLVRRVLERLEARAVGAAEWDRRLEALLAQPAGVVPGVPVLPLVPSVPLAQREAEQYEAPRPGEARWYDSHEQPEHQALLLEHTLRELMSLLFHLSLTAERDQGVLVIEESSVERVLRGDPEYISLEKRRAPHGKMHVSPDALARQLAAVGQGTEQGFFRSILFEGSASEDECTGRCLPRKYLWTH